MKIFGIAFFCIFCLVSCTSHQDCNSNSQENMLLSTMFTTQSAEYQALCFQAYRFAEQQLLNFNGNPSEHAVVLDIDETILDNSPYSEWQIKQDSSYSYSSWKRWTDKAEAKAVPGVSRFLKIADSLGFHLFFISNRKVGELESTMQNMKALGMPVASESQFLLKTTTSNKAERRKKLIDSGIEIAMLVGDNLGDFSEIFDEGSNQERKHLAEANAARFGKQWIVLPNAHYGTWKKELEAYSLSIKGH